MRLLLTTNKDNVKKKFHFKAALSNNLSEQYPKIFWMLKKDIEKEVEINIYERENKNLTVDTIPNDKYVYEIFCNTRQQKRIIERRVGKKLKWVKII